jgi:hypothetical protein
MPIPCPDLEAHQQAAVILFEGGPQGDGAGLGELDGVAGEVEQGLAQAGRVAPGFRRSVVHRERSPLAPALSAIRERT